MSDLFVMEVDTVIPTGTFLCMDVYSMSNRELISLSIRKWQYLRDSVVDLGYVIFPGGQRTCALCVVYEANSCLDCPIAIDAGDRHCRKTPNEAYECLPYGKDRDSPKEVEQALQLIDQELELLNKLLEQCEV